MSTSGTAQPDRSNAVRSAGCRYPRALDMGNDDPRLREASGSWSIAAAMRQRWRELRGSSRPLRRSKLKCSGPKWSPLRVNKHIGSAIWGNGSDPIRTVVILDGCLVSDVEIGRGVATAHSDILARHLDQDDLDVVGRHAEPLQILDDGLVERTLCCNGSARKHRDLDMREPLTRSNPGSRNCPARAEQDVGSSSCTGVRNVSLIAS